MYSWNIQNENRKNYVADTIRVHSQLGVVGTIEFHPNMTLVDARTQIIDLLDNVPRNFAFIFEDGAPISEQQEKLHLVSSFYPCIRIREVRLSNKIVKPTNHLDTNDLHPSELLNDSPEKVSIQRDSGEEMHIWCTQDTTFQHIRQDAARFWNLPFKEIVLIDTGGVVWADQVKVRSITSSNEFKCGKIIATIKHNRSNHFSGILSVSDEYEQDLGASRNMQPQQEDTHQELSQLIENSARIPDSIRAEDIEEALWRVFTFYCISGDSLDLEFMKAHQFKRLLRDSNLVSGIRKSSFPKTNIVRLTPAMVDIIYASETRGRKGKAVSGGAKMSFEEFLNALAQIPEKIAYISLPTKASPTLTHEAIFSQLIHDNILRFANTWNTDTWKSHSKLIRTTEIVSFMSLFVEPLVDIYTFYSRSCLINPVTTLRQSYMSHGDFVRFMTEFGLSKVGLTGVDAAQVFLSACSSPTYEVEHGEMTNKISEDGIKLHTSQCSQMYSDITQNIERLIPTQFVLKEDDSRKDSYSDIKDDYKVSESGCNSPLDQIRDQSDGFLCFPLADGIIEKHSCMSFSAFLDALARSGLVIYTKHNTTALLKPLTCVKALFHHLGRSLPRARVLELCQQHATNSAHGNKFYTSSIAFTSKILDVWKYDGSPDYVSNLNTGRADNSSCRSCFSIHCEANILNNSQNSGKSIDITPTLSKGYVSPSRSPQRISMFSPLAVADLPRNNSLSGKTAGRGRETLDRLTQYAIIEREIRSTYPVDKRIYDNEHGENVQECDEESGFLSAMQKKNGLESPKLETWALPRWASPSKSHKFLREQIRYFEEILVQGSVFQIHYYKGQPQPCHVYCSQDFVNLCWRSISSNKSLIDKCLTSTLQLGYQTSYGLSSSTQRDSSVETNGSEYPGPVSVIPLAQVVLVVPGDIELTRFAFLKHLSDEKMLKRCLSIVAENQRLDLEARNERTRDIWLNALIYLKTHRLKSMQPIEQKSS